MKRIIIPSSIKQIVDTLDYSDAYLIGFKDMSINMNFNVDFNSLDEIKKIIKDKELFIAINKNMTNDDIEKLKNILLKLNDYSIKGVFYADTSIVSLSRSIKLNYDLVWSNEHSTTNYNTINYWYNFGVNYTYISSDITLKEILEIKNNTQSKLIVPIFGYLPMFASKRHIVKNYLNYFNLEDNSKINYIYKENKTYPIIDNKMGTIVYSSNILDGFNALNDLEKYNIDYVTFNSFNISEIDFIEVLKIYSGKSKRNICQILKNTDTGFLYKETIYKVKR